MMVAVVSRTPTHFCRGNPPPGFGPLPTRKIPKRAADSYDAAALVFDIDLNETLLSGDMANAVIGNFKSREGEGRPRTDYLEVVQEDGIDPIIRARCVDWMVFSSYQLWLSQDTLHLAVNCLDRYLSGIEVDPESLQFVGLTCLMIASKFHEVGQPHIDFESYDLLTKFAFSNIDFIRMENRILSYLNYDVAIPTVWSFLERFACAARAGEKAPLQGLESIAAFLAETSLVSYDMLRFPPSVIAASCVFLARYILAPQKRPWNATLQHYTQYRPSDLRYCVLTRPGFFFKNCLSKTTPAIMNKYSHVAMKTFPSYIPPEYFEK